MTFIEMIDYIIEHPKYVWVMVSFVAMMIFIISIIRLHMSKAYAKFNIIGLIFYDNTTGYPSDSKMRINLAYVITTWAFIYLTVADKLTEWYVVAYVGAWVTDRIFSRNSKTTDTFSLKDESRGD